MWNRDDLIYFAGFVDGEGCFYIGLVYPDHPIHRPRYSTILKVSNTDYEIMLWIKNTFGATFEQTKRPCRKSQIIRPVYNTYISGDFLTKICNELLPFLKIKKPHCQNMIKMRSTFFKDYGRGSAKVSEEEKAIRQECHKTSRLLNSRFHNHYLKEDSTLAPYCPSANHAARSSKSIRKGL